MTKRLTKLKLSGNLESLVKACEKMCIAECCGIDAFDFSPLHIASHMSAYTGEISETDIKEIEDEIDRLISAASDFIPDENGFICSISEMNQLFRKDDIDKFARQLKDNIRLAPKVIEYADKIQK
jgi:hypothetical protein